MQITEGIRIFFNYKASDEYIQSKILLSDGICDPAVENKITGHYLENSIIPKKPWRQITPQEKELLLSKNASLSYQTNIGLVKLPEEITKPFEETGVTKAQDMTELNGLFARYPEKIKTALESLMEFVTDYRSPDTDIEPLGLFMNDTGLLTTTKNEEGIYMGLHFDNSKYLDPNSLQLSLNRIAINFGSEQRVLLFINKTLEDIIGLINKFEKTDYRQFESKRQVVALFRKYYPDYPVIKIYLEPFEAYIAPVSNIIHDSSTEDKKEKDISMHLLGSFTIAKNQALTAGYAD